MTSAQRDYQDASDTGMATLAPREHDGSIRRILYIYVFDQRISVGNINTSRHIRKKMQSLILLLLLALSPSLNLAQYPPTPSGLTVVHSSVDAAVTISFKEVSISTTFSQVNVRSNTHTRQKYATSHQLRKLTAASSTSLAVFWLNLAAIISV